MTTPAIIHLLFSAGNLLGMYYNLKVDNNKTACFNAFVAGMCLIGGIYSL